MRIAATCALSITLAVASLQPASDALAARRAHGQSSEPAGVVSGAGAKIEPRPKPEIVHYIVPEESRIEFHASSTFGKVTGVFQDWHAELKKPEEKLENGSLKLDIV